MVRAAWLKEKALGVRINGTDWHEGGISSDEAIAFAQALKEHDCDYVDISSGGNAYVKINTFPGYRVPYAAVVKKNVGIATMAVGMIRDPQCAEEILA